MLVWCMTLAGKGFSVSFPLPCGLWRCSHSPCPAEQVQEWMPHELKLLRPSIRDFAPHDSCDAFSRWFESHFQRGEQARRGFEALATPRPLPCGSIICSCDVFSQSHYLLVLTTRNLPMYLELPAKKMPPRLSGSTSAVIRGRS